MKARPKEGEDAIYLRAGGPAVEYDLQDADTETCLSATYVKWDPVDVAVEQISVVVAPSGKGFLFSASATVEPGKHPWTATYDGPGDPGNSMSPTVQMTKEYMVIVEPPSPGPPPVGGMRLVRVEGA